MQNIAKETRFQIRKKRKLSLNPERNLVVSGFDKIPENYITKLNVILNLRWTTIGLITNSRENMRAAKRANHNKAIIRKVSIFQILPPWGDRCSLLSAVSLKTLTDINSTVSFRRE